MARKIILLRHGESADKQPNQSDFDRVLTERGRASIERLARILSNENLIPDYFLASPAIRTKQTSAIIIEQLAPSLIPQVEMDLYNGDDAAYVKQIFSVNTNWTCLILIGHNPSISSLAGRLTHKPFVGLHPGEAAILEFEKEITQSTLIKTIGPLW
jgi:phosphohistidine phosphatase